MKKIIICMLLLLALIFTQNAGAVSITLSDDNSVAQIETQSQLGMHTWLVDGYSVLYQQWFWYRIGNNGPEHSIDSLNNVSNITTDLDADGNMDNLQSKYADQAGAFEITVNYGLMGGSVGSRTSDIAETIRINNNTSSNLAFHLFQYTDFDIPAGYVNDVANRSNVNTILQDGSLFFTETNVTRPQHWAIAGFPVILSALNDATPTTLWDGVNGLPPGDMTFAFEWDRVITGNGSFIISKDKNVSVPEPGTMFLLGSLATGLFGFAGLRRRFTK